ncbi:3-carboxy-cis,cis-muconate cycloisomerase [Actinophytocola xanthii]|uniref:3-carboxy-cis,cis-muconate cycloisomerase n=1 Tax=Actinophytocola xanthii TaxID=1912961 RepID=A0A1Q8CRS1_9PSEU|nr:3-carboxy-cis,cis-muconate cycloisomerase [Actinophytocola xanthii]OLF17058.1 3-carboxy-cis,cis-muconate cycloisomerase [Actinophytocola xanthii]
MLFDEVLAAGPVRDLVSDGAWLRAMLEAEAALASAQADVGLVERSVADEIAGACDPARFDVAQLGRDAADSGNPAAPLARALTALVSADAARYVHFGATSQDVVDTAAMLVSRRAVSAVLVDVWACCDALGSLCAEHRDTVQAGRTLLQQALPTTFGLTVAGWLSSLGAAGRALAGVRPAAQLGGAVGTLASLGEAGPAVLAKYARRLGLAEPDMPWHTDRGRVLDLATGLGRVSASVGKIAGDVVLLAQTEVGELSEVAGPGVGGSSTMPHKRNPVAAVAARAAAAQAPGMVATLLANSGHEHQRAAGAWHAEWRPLTELLAATGSAVWWLRTSVSRLAVHPDRMRENLARTGGALLAERVTTELTPRVGRLVAHDAVAECVRAGGDLAQRLAEHPALGLDRERAAELLDPAGYLGAAGEFVDRALAAHARRKDGQ